MNHMTLHRGKFWAALSAAEQAALKGIARVRELESGQTVFLEESPYEGFFVVETGACKVYQVSVTGKEAILRFFLPGDEIAIVPFLNGTEQYPASCAAITKTRLLFFEARRCAELCRNQPGLLAKLRGSLGSSAEFFRDKTALLMLGDVQERVMTFFRDLDAHLVPVHLNIPKNQIALYLGMTPEAFSRAILALKQKGALVEQDGSYSLRETI
jgi:CRP/FNR family transcriptional regulator